MIEPFAPEPHALRHVQRRPQLPKDVLSGPYMHDLAVYIYMIILLGNIISGEAGYRS